jgi:hypothetical protein
VLTKAEDHRLRSGVILGFELRVLCGRGDWPTEDTCTQSAGGLQRLGSGSRVIMSKIVGRVLQD